MLKTTLHLIMWDKVAEPDWPLMPCAVEKMLLADKAASLLRCGVVTVQTSSTIDINAHGKGTHTAEHSDVQLIPDYDR